MKSADFQDGFCTFMDVGKHKEGTLLQEKNVKKQQKKILLSGNPLLQKLRIRQQREIRLLFQELQVERRIAECLDFFRS